MNDQETQPHFPPEPPIPQGATEPSAATLVEKGETVPHLPTIEDTQQDMKPVNPLTGMEGHSTIIAGQDAQGNNVSVDTQPISPNARADALAQAASRSNTPDEFNQDPATRAAKMGAKSEASFLRKIGKLFGR